MAVIPTKIQEIIFECVTELEKNGVAIDKVILFGSYANGTFTQDSDIDLLIVSPLFEGNRIKDKNKIRKYVLQISSRLDVLPCSRQEFKEKNPFIEEIIQKGLKITFAKDDRHLVAEPFVPYSSSGS